MLNLLVTFLIYNLRQRIEIRKQKWRKLKLKAEKTAPTKKQRQKSAGGASKKKSQAKNFPSAPKKLQLVETAAGGRIGYSGGFSLVYRLLFCNSPRHRTGRFPHPAAVDDRHCRKRAGNSKFRQCLFRSGLSLGTALLCQKRHYCHRRPAFLFPFGFDPIAFTRAMVANLVKGRYAQGGSTITQQVAKNLFLTPQKISAARFRNC